MIFIFQIWVNIFFIHCQQFLKLNKNLIFFSHLLANARMLVKYFISGLTYDKEWLAISLFNSESNWNRTALLSTGMVWLLKWPQKIITHYNITYLSYRKQNLYILTFYASHKMW